MTFSEYDDDILLLCEDLQNVLRSFKVEHPWVEGDETALGKRIATIEKAILSEQRLIEDISLPGRFIVEHFSTMLNEIGYSMGFQYREVKSGRGPLNNVVVGSWGTITIKVGDIELSWRDQDVQYMFYPDQVVVRPKDSAEDEMTFYFSYSFKYALGQLKLYQGVKDDPQTAYWHSSLLIED